MKRTFNLFVLVTVLALTFSAMGVFPAYAATLTVQSAADDGTAVPANCPGVNCRLRDAIAAANSGDTINFAGDYTIHLVFPLFLGMGQGLTIDGSGHNVVLSGDTNGDGTGDTRVLSVSPNSGEIIVLSHLTITKGNADWGGGLITGIADGSLTVKNCTFSDNNAALGGGIYVSSNSLGNASVTDSAFINNSAAQGGGIYIEAQNGITVAGSTFSNNTVTDAGGGIYNLGLYATDAMTVTDSAFTGNSATNSGGGIHNLSALDVTDSEFINNEASYGGGVFNQGALTVADSAFSLNETLYGGGILNFGGTLAVTGSTFAGNSATSGGGVFNNTASGTCASASAAAISNSTFSGNSATSGGGISNVNGVITLLFDTVTANTSGGGVRSFNDGTTCTKVGSSIIAGNAGYDLSADATAQRFYSLDRNLVGVAGANVDFGLEFNQPHDLVNLLDPHLGALDDYGGPTLTHALLPGPHPAKGLGDNTACAASPIDGKDQRGATRDPNCDIGAYEFLNAPYPSSPADGADVQTNRPTLHWGIYLGATHYQIQYSTFSDFSSKVKKATIVAPTTTYTPKKNLLPNTTYYWRVAAKVDGVYGPWSETWSFTTGNPPPIPKLSAPGNNKSVAGPSPMFDWKDVTAPVGVTLANYNIQIATDAGFTAIVYSASPVLSQDNLAVLTSGTTYYWRVRSVATSGDFSAWSKVRIVTIL